MVIPYVSATLSQEVRDELEDQEVHDDPDPNTGKPGRTPYLYGTSSRTEIDFLIYLNSKSVIRLLLSASFYCFLCIPFEKCLYHYQHDKYVIDAFKGLSSLLSTKLLISGHIETGIGVTLGNLENMPDEPRTVQEQCTEKSKKNVDTS